MHTNPVLRSLTSRYPYLSIDNTEFAQGDHPQVTFAEYNRTDPERVMTLTRTLDRVIDDWAYSHSLPRDPLFHRGTEAILSVLRMVSATSVIVALGEQLLVERAGSEFPGTRRREVTSLVYSVTERWEDRSVDERKGVAALCLLGLTGLQAEVANYLDLRDVTTVIARMLSRLEMLGSYKFSATNCPEELQLFRKVELEVLEEADASLTIISSGTRTRVYTSKLAIQIDGDAYRFWSSALADVHSDRLAFVMRFFSLVWREFADEGLIVLHENEEADAFALLGGCMFRYHARKGVDEHRGTPGMVSDAVPTWIDTCGEFAISPWRRDIKKLSFDGGIEKLIAIRQEILRVERLSEKQRRKEASNKVLATAAKHLLGRQVNYNPSHVLNGQMERIQGDQWGPNMCRDRNGRICNPPHAMGGVGEMFRGLLDFGQSFSQFRTWRELDGTHGFADIRKFRALKKILEEGIARTG